ncbi:hypothetical protein GT711_28370 [Clostridium beijerinckii]|uniref:hypothetical protein n=1 Tax=Clostridium beijerinckii TaxID=1520 RepID=UPI00136B3501|nr:hypothetical protein [Clostridium beijerinckii]MZK54165.1 hypothetical protein [Clostridium beijerinckii]MZK62181.1 hypothetical protein [Clostridium beijerinckii]MZK87428.1 hypothetical protein [Clostridium beijerinckii]MZL40999.1 hypothetical protein [Clostridium beijerinckii]
MKFLKNIYKKHKLNQIAKQYGFKRRKSSRLETLNDFHEYLKNNKNIKEFNFPVQDEVGILEVTIKSIFPFGKKELNFIKQCKPIALEVRINNKSLFGNKYFEIR